MREKKKLLAVLSAVFVCLLGVWGLLLFTEDGSAGRIHGQTEENINAAAANGTEDGTETDTEAGAKGGAKNGTGNEAEAAQAVESAGATAGENAGNKDGEAADADTGTEDSVCVLADFTPDEVERVEIRNAAGDYVIVSADAAAWQDFGEAAGENPAAQGFMLAGYEKYRQDREALDTTVRLLSSVTATQLYERDFDKEKFGLEEPAATVEIFGKGETITLYLGSWNESAAVWYAMKEGEEGLYCVSRGIGDRMTQTPLALLDMTLIPAFDVESEEMTKRLTRVLVERPDLEEPLEIVASTGSVDAYTSPYELVSPVHVKTSLKAVREQIGSLFGLSAKKAAGVYDAKEASVYGLDRPSMVMTIEHDDRELTLTVGDRVREQEGEERYFICSDSDLLFIIEESRLPLFEETVDDLFFKMALLPKIDQIREVYLNLRGEEYLFALTYEGKQSGTAAAKGGAGTGGKKSKETETDDRKTGDGKNEIAADDRKVGDSKNETAASDRKTSDTRNEAAAGEEILRVTLDGEALDADLFRTFYSFLLEVDIEQINRDSHGGEPEMVLEYRRLDGKSDRLEVYRLADARRMGIVVNGEASFEGRIAYLDKLQTELSHLLAGEKIDTNW